MSFTKNLTRALHTQPLRQQPRHLPYASAEPLEYRLSKLSLSKIKQESARPEPDLRHVVGYASVNRAAGDKMYQNLVRSVELLRTEKKGSRSSRREVKDGALAAFAKRAAAVGQEDVGVETRVRLICIESMSAVKRNEKTVSGLNSVDLIDLLEEYGQFNQME
ncbi:hypothetical protein BBP40_002940 [Aspergillus hancockii]|nr:hypothetical protein BBP40_002940 [Aspergillus hancockii]